MKLSIEMVPKSTWNCNLRSILKKKQWDIIRKYCYGKAGYHCEICGKETKLHCHEVWKYEQINGKNIQRLDGLVALCGDCHLCKHFGFALVMHHNGEISINKVLGHLMDINEIAEDECRKILNDEIDLWAKRSEMEWELNTDYINHYIKVNNLEI